MIFIFYGYSISKVNLLIVIQKLVLEGGGKMKLVDELYAMYRNKLTGDEEDIDMLTFAFLEEMSHEDLLALIQEMDKQELYDLMGLYLIESLKGKFAQEEYGQHRTHTYYPRNIH